MSVPYTFATATSSIPLSQLDSNFATAITLGSTNLYLGNTTTSIAGLANVSSTVLTSPILNAGTSTALQLQSNGTTGIYMDTSQNVGIGTSSPSYKLDVNGSTRIGGGNSFYATGNSYLGSSSGSYSTFLTSNVNWNYDELVIQRNASNTSNVRFLGFYLDGDTTGNTNFSAYPGFQVSYSGSPTTGSTSIGLSASLNIATTSTMTFSRNVSGTSTESMRIDSSGRLLVGTTTPYDVNSIATFSNSTHGLSAVTTATGGGWYALECGRTGSTGKFIGFTYPSAATEVGSVSYNGTNTLYNATSDQRLKENIVDAETAFETINQIKIRSFDWIESKVHETHGVIAQELQQIAPQCVTEGTTNEDGSMGSPWQIDTSPLIPLLIKSIQELKAIVDTQAEQIKALQGAK